METPKVLPKDLMGRQTTAEQWEQYQLDLKNHEAWVNNRKEYLQRVLDYAMSNGIEDAHKRFMHELDQALSMDAPNEPGYYRANND